MERREFVTMAMGALVAGRTVKPSLRTARPPDHLTATQLGAEVFSRRVERLRAELTTRKLDLFVAAPSTNYAYLTGYNPGRSERFIGLFVPVRGAAVIVCPAFEVERITRNTTLPGVDVRGWEEQDSPFVLVRQAIGPMKPQRARGEAILEGTLDYDSSLRLEAAFGSGWRTQSAQPVTDRLRMIKFPEELALIRGAIAITEAAIAAAFAALTPGVTERQVADALADDMRRRGASSGGGLVQFGPSSALPHGGPGGPRLEKEMVVLIDAGCQVGGYTSDITRTIWYGDTPSDEFKKVFNLVHDAQTAAMQLGVPFTVTCEQMDAAARRMITTGGYGPSFTHRLGHGLGMDGHEVPYLVQGNETRLEPGMVFTIEPGIYQLGKFGVRIEDDVRVTDSGLEVLTHRPTKF